MLLLSIDWTNLHELLRSLYGEMMPLCEKMAGVARGVAGLGALFYVAYRVWQSLSRAEPIDVFPLLRPFVLGLCIMFFPSMVLGTINGILSPVCSATSSLVEQQTFDMKKYQEEKDESFNKDYLSSPGNKVTSRSTSAYYDRTLDQTYNAVLNYNYQINKDHYLDAMAGFEYYDSYNKGFNASGSGAPTDDFMDLQYTSKEEGKRSIDSWHSRQRIMSFFGRVNYDYQSKYLLSLVLRKDGYSKLAKENRWGVFPGVSTGWVFSKEKFMANTSDILSFGKLRASFGLNGNVNKNFVGNYTVQGSYGSNTYNGATGFLLGSIPNPYLMWEKSRTFEIGLDLGFLENRINANLTYYNRLTSDKYANITVPSTSGVGSVVSNNGKFQNQGFEFELAFRIIDRKDWKWNLNWNGALNKNKVVALPDNGLERNRQDAYQVYTGYGDAKMWVGGYQEGQRPGDLYMFIADGIYKSQDEIPAGLIDITSGNNGSTGRPLYGGAEGYNKLSDSQKENALPIQPGDVKWKDVNGDGVIDNYDMVKVGNTVPKWTGGFNTTVSWKDLTLSARFDKMHIRYIPAMVTLKCG